MSGLSRNILRSLTPEHREKLVKCLNSTNCWELLGIKGVGYMTMNGFVADSLHTHDLLLHWDEGVLREYYSGEELPWLTFIAYPSGVFFRAQECRGCQRDQLSCISKVFKRPALLNVLAHFVIPLEVDVNEHLTELRGIKSRLELFRHMENPVIQDYLRDLLYQLRDDA